MNFDKYSFDELDIELIFYIRDELEKRIGSQSIEAIIVSGFLNRLQDDPVYVHHYDEKYWADYILSRYQKKELLTI
ncbi:hypothetical protein SAMN05880501_101162 [Ureibacillus xyleni]|uniref:Uncharacterized protein n=1 Tax=Ureibacillus xyleni TaxID=614648 RepID=A0A285R9L5_9BACL|nr:hypothetical protein [Ureibacillus xyleni]SOB90448.1 hypothetical protein SAMN05880501_101162 [Ureibacillus xyleni]